MVYRGIQVLCWDEGLVTEFEPYTANKGLCCCCTSRDHLSDGLVGPKVTLLTENSVFSF